MDSLISGSLKDICFTGEGVRLPGLILGISTCWDKVTSFGKVEHCERGNEVVCKEHEFFYIQSGLLTSYIDKDLPIERATLILGNGALLREAYVSAGIKNYKYHHYCLANAVIYKFHIDFLKEIYLSDEYAFLRENILFSLTSKIILDDFLLFLIRQSSYMCRVLNYLLLVQRFLLTHPKADLQLSQARLGMILGIHKSTMNRIFARLKTAGLVQRFSPRGIKLGDFQNLPEDIRF